MEEKELGETLGSLKKKDSNKTYEYMSLNALCKMATNMPNRFDFDREAVVSYIKDYVEPRSRVFSSTEERFEYLLSNNYYDSDVVGRYHISEIVRLREYAFSFKHSFPSFMGAYKFYNSYCLKSFDLSVYLETYEDRVLMTALFLAGGDIKMAERYIKYMMLGRYQPATPTFLNAGKKQRGEYVSCYLLRVEDNMESIGRAVTTSLQLSKRGGGVALCLTNLREFGAPIKNIKSQSTGIIPVMKILEDSFSYANQLGQRQGSGAVYLNVHHPEILGVLDTKRENADEKIRIKSLSLGVMIPDITFELAKENKEMALFSPYDVERVYGKPLSDISITEEYEKLVSEPRIKKTYINARKLFQTIAELHFESGYPYIIFDDTVNRRNAHPERIVMSNLCSEIVQPSTISTFNSDLSFSKVGYDICCNLGSLNIAKAMESGPEFPDLVEGSIMALDHVSRNSDLSSAPSIEAGNRANHALGLGAMNLHGFLATNKIYYNSAEALDFTNIFFYTVAYHAFKTSSKLAKKYSPFKGFERTKFADGSYFKKYTDCDDGEYLPKTDRIKELFEDYGVKIPTKDEWITLVNEIKRTGLANSHLMAIAPTGSISYLSSCTPSLQPVVDPIEVRKEAKLGRVYVPAYNINDENKKYYQQGAYELGPEPIINIAAEAQKHVDQAISLTLFMNDTATTRDLNKAYIYAFKKGCSSLYYVRVRQEVLSGSENIDCSSCTL